MVILDTNIIIDHLRKHEPSASHLITFVKTHPKELLCVSMITVQELYEGKSTRDPSREKDLLATIAPLKILPYTYEIAKRAGSMARDLDAPIELADAAIAATAIEHDADLFTLNVKDFRAIPTLSLIAP